MNRCFSNAMMIDGTPNVIVALRWPGRRLFGKDQSAEVFGDVVRVTVDDAGRLPAKEVSPGIGTFAFDAVQVHPPTCTRPDWNLADRSQWNAGGSIPGMRLLVDASRGFPAGTPFAVITLARQVD